MNEHGSVPIQLYLYNRWPDRMAQAQNFVFQFCSVTQSCPTLCNPVVFHQCRPRGYWLSPSLVCRFWPCRTSLCYPNNLRLPSEQPGRSVLNGYTTVHSTVTQMRELQVTAASHRGDRPPCAGLSVCVSLGQKPSVPQHHCASPMSRPQEPTTLSWKGVPAQILPPKL